MSFDVFGHLPRSRSLNGCRAASMPISWPVAINLGQDRTFVGAASVVGGSGSVVTRRPANRRCIEQAYRSARLAGAV